MSRPMPAAMAYFSESGIAATSLSQTPRRDKMTKSRPDRTMAPKATCQEYPRPPAAAAPQTV